MPKLLIKKCNVCGNHFKRKDVEAKWLFQQSFCSYDCANKNRRIVYESYKETKKCYFCKEDAPIGESYCEKCKHKMIERLNNYKEKETFEMVEKVPGYLKKHFWKGLEDISERKGD